MPSCPEVILQRALDKVGASERQEVKTRGGKGFHSMFPETWVFFHSLNNVEIDEELGPSPLYQLKITREREREPWSRVL